MISRNKTLLFSLCTCILLLNLYSCTRASSDSEFSAAIGMEVQHYLNITNMFKSPIKPYTTITLYIVNKTLDCVVFPYNFGVKIFVYQNQGWIEIPDNVVYAYRNNVVLDPHGGLDEGAIVAIQPDYSKLGVISNRQRMRVVLIGELCKKGLPSNQLTADYIELTVEP